MRSLTRKPLTQTLSLGLCLAAFATGAAAQEGPVPANIPHLDHVFVIMMENHGYSQIIDNPNAPFINKYAHSANTATNYYAVAHPSLTNYLEVVGGSNFGILNDNSPLWHSTSCTPNIVSGITAWDVSSTPNNCPIAGHGTDAATPAVDFKNENSTPAGTNNIDGIASLPADPHILGKSIADQLVTAGRTYKSYQESLPIGGADLVNNSDGYFSNLTDFTKITPVLTPPLTASGIVNLYAVKHNPFVYFQSTEEGHDSRNTLNNTVSFEGQRGLWADLATGHVPTYSFIAPNQCHDQHGRGNAGPYCNYDPTTNGTQAGLNPALIQLGDVTVERLVKAIHSSPAWKDGRNAIVLLWDENDYSDVPNTNLVLTVVDTNYGVQGTKSNVRYTHFSLLKSIEGGLGLPCLNHACDNDVKTMSDLFATGDHHDNDANDDSDRN
jgi:phosphatidylinositol-3-phosphatase